MFLHTLNTDCNITIIIIVIIITFFYSALPTDIPNALYNIKFVVVSTATNMVTSMS